MRLERLENLKKDNTVSLDPANLTIQKGFHIPVSPFDELKYRNIDGKHDVPFYQNTKIRTLKLEAQHLINGSTISNFWSGPSCAFKNMLNAKIIRQKKKKNVNWSSKSPGSL